MRAATARVLGVEPMLPLEYEFLMIGSVDGGPDKDRRWRDAERDLLARLDSLQGEDEAPFWVNLVYHYSGEFLQNDWTGVRAGAYSKKQGRLMVQAAVPDEAEPSYAVLVELLERSVEAVSTWAKKKRLTDLPIQELRDLAAAVSADSN